ncbi:hypothetical protein GQ53DRAFT_222662 [Thozetella sp. PMI_491]|nr:hypothetical protein GQ53DRAFT_222662 [Thozetella sp. PMI_491]
MAPRSGSSGSSSGPINMKQITTSLQSSSAAPRGTALESLILYFERSAKGLQDPLESRLEDKTYHTIYEALFRCTLLEKEALLGAKRGTKSAASTQAYKRLGRSAKALKEAVADGAPCIKRKTARALVDHITQILPGPDENYLEPLLADYVKAFTILVETPSVVEGLSSVDGKGWQICVDFSLELLSRYLESADCGPDSHSRASPAPGTGLVFSLPTSSSRSLPTTQRSSGQVGSQMATGILSALSALVSGTNAPVHSRAAAISGIVLQLLQIRSNKISELHKLSFSVVNSVFGNIQADDLTLAGSIARDLVPLLTHWWQPRALSRDAMLNSIRDEMLKTMFGIHLHLECLARTASDGSLLPDIEDLLDALWLDYSRRGDQMRLQLDDLSFTTMTLPDNYPRTSAFSLRPFDQPSEQNWSLLENMAILEDIHARASQHHQPQNPADDEQPRKRRRLGGDSTKLHQKLMSIDSGVRLTALQLIPFYFTQKTASLDEVTEALGALSSLVSDKQSLVASWAMLACSSIAVNPNSQHKSLCATWKHTWQFAARSISLPGTSRAACALLHSVMKSALVPWGELADDVNQIVTTADISGPTVLVDSSLSLMLGMLRLRNTLFPNASQSTSNHIIRWAFARWSPAEFSYASLHSRHASPFELSSLLRACCGLPVLASPNPLYSFGGTIWQYWKGQKENLPVMRYLLLLGDAESLPITSVVSANNAEEDSGQASDPGGAHASKRLILELLFPKLQELSQMAESWHNRGGDGSLPISAERLRSLMLACITATLLLPELIGLNSAMSRDIETVILGTVDSALKAILDSAQSESYMELLRVSASPFIPPLAEAELSSLKESNRTLLSLFSKISHLLRENSQRGLAGEGINIMDIDDDFELRETQKSSSSKPQSLSRRDIILGDTPEAFHLDVDLRLRLLDIVLQDDGQIGLVPETLVDHIVGLPDEQFLASGRLMRELFELGLNIAPGDATRIVEAIGAIINKAAFTCCEIAMSTCINIMVGLISLWTNENLDMWQMVGDLYHFLVKQALPNRMMSPNAQVSLASLFFRILEVKPKYATDIGLPSSRSTLFTMLRDQGAKVKYFISQKLPNIFGLYVLKDHDNIFVDILSNLPSDPENEEGIAFRLIVLAELACRWPTLLRRCIYHIFETPGRILQSAKYATACLCKVSAALRLGSPQELFGLFAPQLLYTWLEGDSIDGIAFEIFGFASLNELISTNQTEAAAIMIMRGQEKEACDLALKLGRDPIDLIKDSFTKVIAYTVAYDISMPPTDQHITGESRVRKLLGKEAFQEKLHLNFADIIGTFFNIFDQENAIEDSFRKDKRLAYAADIMDEIKKFSHLETKLPPNQQPMFKAKFLQKEVVHVCSRTPWDVETLWTPALIVSIARRLLNTVHPALGPLHACSVVRKIRVLVCLAGPKALSSYPLEMLLHSLRPFIVEQECADDALGISQYLIHRGDQHLRQVPSFLAGYSLSSLADLRLFLESSQASTTQESQFKATKGRAQMFHSWFSRYLSGYDSAVLEKDDRLRSAFKLITDSAARIRASGNADKGTHESSLLLEILKDWECESPLLNEPSRQIALSMLCGVFRAPSSNRADIIETDEDALNHGAVIWKSCGLAGLSRQYMAWAGRAVGRFFAASGEVPYELLRESRLEEYRKLSFENSGSDEGLLNLVEALSLSGDCRTASLAESALRTVISDAIATEDNILIAACQKSLSEALFTSSDWSPYNTPPSDCTLIPSRPDAELFSIQQLDSRVWPREIAIYLAQSAPNLVTLSVLPPLLSSVPGFAEQAFPFIVHLVLLDQLDKQQGVKRRFSDALKEWLKSTSPAATENLRLLINTILYLRTQQLPNEASIADRTHWLEVNFGIAAGAATRCGMFKVALLFAEVAHSEHSRTSRRSSAVREGEDSTDALLNIFENIDDPDAYYGLVQDASLANVLARLEYENDGSKSLAFRGAQYDSHLRRRDAASRNDGQALVTALGSLGLSGLSNSLVQAQQSLDGATTSLDSMYATARRLEMWNLPVPQTSGNSSVTMYRAYKSMHQANDVLAVKDMVQASLRETITHVSTHSISPPTLRHRLASLAALTELDDLLGVSDSLELQSMLNRFESRSKWMMSGRYNDISQILSCRETTLSMLSQQHRLRPTTIGPGDARLVQIRAMLLSSTIYRFHRATQETLNLSTSLTDLIGPSEEMGLSVDAAVRIEAANSLWDHAEMISSIRMLQSIDRDSTLKKQTVPVSRTDLLSKIGYQVSVARLESPDSIQRHYLEPALKELKGRTEGKEAGRAFHQFAMFCDEQLQNPDGLEDLARLQSLKKGKSDEVAQLKLLIQNAKDSQHRTKYSGHLAKAKQWLDLDQQELRRVEQTRDEFVRLSLENYLLSLAASDDHNSDALRFTAIWLERADEEATNEAVKKHVEKVATRKFAPLVNQLTSRLQDQSTAFQRLLINLVYRICVDHPYHGMYQIWSGARTRMNKDDDVAVSRQKATNRIAKALEKADVAGIWRAIDQTSRVYHMLAMDRDQNRYKSGHRMAIKDSPVGQEFLGKLSQHPIPPPTMQIELAPTMDYSHVPMIHKFESTMSIASGVSAPKILTAVGSDGCRYKQLVKGGNDDLRQDAIMEQVFAAVSELLKLHRTTRQRNLGIRTYKVLPLTASSGLIEFVSDTIPLHEYLMPAHERYYPKDLKGSHCRKEISNAQTKTVENRISTYRKVTDRFHPVMRYFFMEYFVDPDEWFLRRTAYTRTTAAISVLGHVLGLGDRHGHNILLDSKTGEVVHIDLGVAFEMGRVLPVPELVPFRLTRDIVDGMGITKTEGIFRRCCEFTLDALREETYSIMTILDVLRYDPLYSWSISPVRMAKLQNARGTEDETSDDQAEVDNKKPANEPSEADRALEVVRKKLSKTLSVTATVNDLINQATDERNLAVLYSGMWDRSVSLHSFSYVSSAHYPLPPLSSYYKLT